MVPGRLALALFLAMSLPAHADGLFTKLGELDPNDPFDRIGSVTSISADGTIAVGYSSGQGFRWTQTGGMVSLINQNGVVPRDISADGSTVVGSYNMGIYSSPRLYAFIWTASTGFKTLPGSQPQSAAYAVSADGSVVVGYRTDTVNGGPFRWTQSEGMRPLAGFNGNGYAYDVSADGSTVVGTGGPTKTYDELAFRWTEQGGVVWLNALPGYRFSSAKSISDDGAVIVGYIWNVAATDMLAFKWTQAGGMTSLGTLPGHTRSWANAISGDGTTVVGTSTGANSTAQGFRWTEATGMQSVLQWLTNAGVRVPADMQLTVASAVNADGSVVAGSSPLGSWLARVTSQHGGGLLADLESYNNSLIEANSRARIGLVDLANLTLFGAHHRSLLDSGLVDGAYKSCAWVTADGARYERSHAESLEIGACTDLGPTRIGLGLGKASARQDWMLGGEGKYRGEYAVAEVAGAFGENLQASLLAYYGRFDVDSSRNYVNGASTLSSVAEPDAVTKAVRARLDWKNAAVLGDFALSPYAVYSWTETELDAYVERGGGFPAAFDASTWSTRDARLGVAAEKKLSSANNLRIAVEGVHRFEASLSGVDGHVLGLFDFELPGQSVKRNWVRALIDFDRRLSERSLVSFGAHGATSGGDADWGVSVGYRLMF